jgi:predicted O-methyltransferase YrrM
MTWQEIPGDTMFDFPDFYKRMAQRLPNNGKACEVGVADGKSAVFFAEHCNKDFTLFVVDNLAYGGQDQLKTILTNVYNSGLHKKFDFRGLGIGSLDASCKLPDQYFDFVFLDSSHEYEMTKVEILLWWRKIKPGGILAGHDAIGIEGVANAVREIIPTAQIEHTNNGHGVWWIERTDTKLC